MVPKYLSTAMMMACLIGMTVHHGMAQDTWRKAVGGFADDRCSSIEVIHDDLVLIAGSTGSFGAGSSDIYLVAVNAQGDRVWSVTIGGPHLEQLSRMRTCANGDLIMVGTYNGEGSGAYDALLIRAGQEGEVIWQRTMGVDDWDFFHDVRELADGGFIIAGETYGQGDPGGNAWVVRTDADGEVLWTRTFGGGGGHVAYTVDATADLGCIVAGSMIDANGDRDALVIKLDGAGDTEWMRTYGGDSLDVAYSIIRTSDGGYSFAGSTRSYGPGIESYHVKLDATGEVVWQWNWGGGNDQEVYDHMQLASDEFILTGYSEYLAGSGRDMYMQKSWVNGAFVFGRAFGGLEEDVALGGRVFNNGYICAGRTSSFGSGGSDMFIVRTDIEGLTASQTVTNVFDPLSIIDPQSLHGLQFHPNPSAGPIHLGVSDVLQLRLTDATGSLMEVIDVAPGTREVLTTVPSGAYFIEAIDRQGRHSGSRLLIVRP